MLVRAARLEQWQPAKLPAVVQAANPKQVGALRMTSLFLLQALRAALMSAVLVTIWYNE